MNIITPPRVDRFKKYERHEPQFLDSSALSELKKCPKKFFFRYILGYTTKNEEIHFSWGKAYHKFREVIEKYHKENPTQPKITAIAMGMQAAAKIWGTKRGVEGTKYEFMTPERLVEMLNVAGQHWIKEKEQGVIKVLETEQPFNTEIAEGINRTGRFDQVIVKENRLWGRDFKTSTKTDKDYDRFIYPNDQFAGYTAAQHKLTGGDPTFEQLKVRGQYVEIMYNGNSTKRGKIEKRGPSIFTKIVEYTPQLLRRWLDFQRYWEANRTAMRENDTYPENETHCPWCPYHRVCRLPTESGQEYELRTQFKFEIWDNSKDDEL